MFFFLPILIFILKWVVLLFSSFNISMMQLCLLIHKQNKENEIKRIISGIFSGGGEPVKRKKDLLPSLCM
jgi:hypothetical protein